MAEKTLFNRVKSAGLGVALMASPVAVEQAQAQNAGQILGGILQTAPFGKGEKSTAIQQVLGGVIGQAGQDQYNLGIQRQQNWVNAEGVKMMGTAVNDVEYDREARVVPLRNQNDLNHQAGQLQMQYNSQRMQNGAMLESQVSAAATANAISQGDIVDSNPFSPTRGRPVGSAYQQGVPGGSADYQMQQGASSGQYQYDSMGRPVPQGGVHVGQARQSAPPPNAVFNNDGSYYTVDPNSDFGRQKLEQQQLRQQQPATSTGIDPSAAARDAAHEAEMQEFRAWRERQNSERAAPKASVEPTSAPKAAPKPRASAASGESFAAATHAQPGAVNVSWTERVSPAAAVEQSLASTATHAAENAAKQEAGWLAKTMRNVRSFSGHGR